MSKQIVTHSGIFHPDDIFAVATLLLIFPDAIVTRSRDKDVVEGADIAVDIGGVYDAELLRFDHHQIGGAGMRGNGIPYASFGLVWKQYGERLAGSEEAAVIEDKLIMPIDAQDNGVAISRPVFEDITDYNIGDFFYSYLDHSTSSDESLQDTFMILVNIAKELLLREVERAREKVTSMKEVKNILDATSDKRIIVLDKELSWKRILIPVPEVLFVVGPRKEGNWGVRAVPKSLNSFELKKPLPESWAGKSDGDLQEVTGVTDAIFCHRDRFLVGAKTKESAIALAKLALAE